MEVPDVPPVVYWILSTVAAAWVFVLYSIVRRIHSDWKEMREERAEELETRRLRQFSPEPLAPEWPRHRIDRHQLDPNTCADLIRADFLSLSRHPEVTRAAISAVNVYGVGSCSPPAFFGSSTPHLEAIDLLKNAFHTTAGLLYAWGTCTVSSVVAAYVDQDDIVFLHVDSSKDLQNHLMTCTQCKVLIYEDIPTLSNMLEEGNYSRALFVIEGICSTTGKIADLARMLKIAAEHKARIILDETLSFGVLGDKGGGVLEYAGYSVDDVDVITGNLEPVWGVVGGFSVGIPSVIDAQQLLSKAYIYTAALPAFLARAFITAHNVRGDRHLKLEMLSLDFDVLLKGLPELCNISSSRSPRKVLAIRGEGRMQVFKHCRDVHRVYLDQNDHGLVINLYYNLEEDEPMRKRLEEALISSAKLLRD